MDEDTERCPSCGTELEEDTTECPDCGELIEESKEEAIDRLQELPGLGRKRAKELYQEGLTSPEKIVEKGESGLADIDQIGLQTAEKILDEAEKLVEEETAEVEEESSEAEQEDVQTAVGEGVLEKIEENEKLEELDEELRDEIEELEQTIEETEESEEVEETERLEEVEEPEIINTKGNFRENFVGLIPVFSSFLIPIFLVLFVGLEFLITLLGYPSVYPARTLYYLTPLPYLESSWISSLTLSFVVTLCLFVTTWKGYQFKSGSGVKLSKYMISVSAVFSVIITISLILHIYFTQVYPGIILTLILLFLALFLLVTQSELLRREETTFPKTEERKVCPECGETVPLDLEECSECGLEITLPQKSEKGVEDLETYEEFEEEEELEPIEDELEEKEIGKETESILKDLEKTLKEVEDETETVVFVCPVCEAELEETVDKCPECGTVFIEDQ